MIIKQIFRILLFCILILSSLKFIEVLTDKKILNIHSFYIVLSFGLHSLFFNIFFNAVNTDSRINTKNYSLSSATRFIYALIYFIIILKNGTTNPIHILISIIITYLLFTSFEVYIILIKLQNRE